MNRYQKYNYLAQSFLISKTPTYSTTNLVSISSLQLQAGHFRFSGLHVEHGLMLATIAGQAPLISTFQHGKRLRRTALLSTHLHNRNIGPLLDKFINVTLPLMEDLRTPKVRTVAKTSHRYVLRLRKYFEGDEMSSLISDRALKKDIFLPLFLDLNLTQTQAHKGNETYLRMLRLPLMFYKYSPPKSIDDGQLT